MEKLDKFVVIDILTHTTFDEIEKFSQIKNKFYKDVARDAIEVKLTTYRQLPVRLCAKLVLIQKFSQQHSEAIVRILSSINDGMVLALVQTQEHVHEYLTFSQALRDHIREHTDDETLKSLEDNNRIIARYVGENPNGSRNLIAGITNERGNVVGLMPHPEHAIDSLTGPSTDGLPFFTSVLTALVGK